MRKHRQRRTPIGAALALLTLLVSGRAQAEPVDGCAKDIDWSEAHLQLRRYGENDPTYRAMRQQAVGDIRRQLTMVLKKMSTSSDGFGPVDATRRYEDNVREIPPLMQRAKCWDPAMEAKWLQQATVIVDKVRLEAKAAQDQEAKCQADPRCMGDRILADLCPAIERRAEVKDSIAENLRYAKKTGAINLQEQYDLGEELKDLDRNISDLKAKYKATTHKPFNSALCPSD